MSKFVLLVADDVTYAVNPANISMIEKCNGNCCKIHFVGGEIVTLNESYSVIAKTLVESKGFTVQ